MTRVEVPIDTEDPEMGTVLISTLDFQGEPSIGTLDLKLPDSKGETQRRKVNINNEA